MKEEKVKIFASIVDDVTRKQVEELSESEAYKDSVIRVMPDCHAGKGCTIGSVIQYTDRIVPNTVGVDIGCGMLVIDLGKIDIDLERLDEVINTYVPSGFGVHEKSVVEFASEWKAKIPEKKKEYIKCSIGSLGGGNHFIEVDVDDKGNKYLVIHSGSRNLGVLICDYWQQKAIAKLSDVSGKVKEVIARLKSEGREKEISSEVKKIKKPVIKKELAYLEGEDMEDYLKDMSVCQSYAILNRETMANIILRHMGLEDKPRLWFHTIHNYVDIPNRIIRKGAISALHGQMVLIPMNMRDGSLICTGKGNEDWLNSAPHGAGRIMSRAKAREVLKMEEFKESMDGIYTTSVCEETIDEAPMVYKSSESIMKDIEPTVNIVRVIKPIYNFKAKTKE